MRFILKATCAALGVVSFAVHDVYACTTFGYAAAGSAFVGKSFDWNFGHGAVMVNKRNVEKVALDGESEGQPARWVSRYGSLTFNQQGRDFPLGGTNEAGLTVEIMIGEAEHIPDTDPRPVVNELQWIQFMLDNFATTAEAVEGASTIRVDKVSVSVHYMICDKSLDCATFEYLDGELVVNHGEDLMARVFTNSTYEESVAYLKTMEGFGGTERIPQDTKSLSRFARAADRVKRYNGVAPVDFGLATIDNVARSDNAWQIVYQTGKAATFRTRDSRSTKSISMANFDFSCRTPVKVIDMNTSQSGDLTGSMADYTTEFNRRLVNQNWLIIGAKLRQQVAAYPATTRCME